MLSGQAETSTAQIKLGQASCDQDIMHACVLVLYFLWHLHMSWDSAVVPGLSDKMYS